MEALLSANHGSALAYGEDTGTAATVERIRERFGAPVEALFAYGGTGANVVALGAVTDAHHVVICPRTAHINVDECAAPERIAGCKLWPVDTPDGKLRPADMVPALAHLGDPHHAQPRVVAISQATEQGTLYAVDEIAAICDEAHRHGLITMLDGARLANAAAALDVDLRAFTIDVGVDIVVFGATKAGAMYGEAVIFCDPALAARAEYVRKGAAQLASKQRFIAAQFDALLADDLWVTLGRHSNSMATYLANAVSAIDGVELSRPQVVNSVFASIPTAVVEPLQGWSQFWVWDPGVPGSPTQEVRWMTAWDTTTDDIDAFAAGISTAIAASSH